MSSFALDNDVTSPNYGDLLIVNNNIGLTAGAEAVRQHLWAKFQIFLGEWFLDLDIGVPWFRDILIKKPSFVVVQQVLKNTILETQGITDLTKFEFTYDAPTREANLDFAATTIDGPIDFSQVVEIGGTGGTA